MTTDRTEICLCAVCREMLYEGDELVEQRVMDKIDGSLDYINLAHIACAPEWIGNDLEDGDFEVDPFNSDAEADADVLASAGMGTDEDYGFFGEDLSHEGFDHLERDHDEPYEPESGE